MYICYQEKRVLLPYFIGYKPYPVNLIVCINLFHFQHDSEVIRS